jgi:hypothetical protein
MEKREREKKGEGSQREVELTRALMLHYLFTFAVLPQVVLSPQHRRLIITAGTEQMEWHQTPGKL